MEEFLTVHFWVAVGQIIMIDILLGGDNAVVIALACRKLPAHQRFKGIMWGTAGAIILRVVLIAFGVLVIGLVDNLLRPMLVGKDTRMPDYVVLISTLGGMALFGLNGFVIGPVIAAMFIAVWDIFATARTAQLETEVETNAKSAPPNR